MVERQGGRLSEIARRYGRYLDEEYMALDP